MLGLGGAEGRTMRAGECRKDDIHRLHELVVLIIVKVAVELDYVS